MNQKELTKTFMRDFKLKKPFGCDVFFTNLFSALRDNLSLVLPVHFQAK